MNHHLKAYLKNIVFAVLLAAILIGIGAYGVTSVSETELRKSTYTRTEFDFHIAAPDAAQVQRVKSNDSVKTVFPYYAYKKAFSSAADVMLIVSDEIDQLGASVLTEGTLIEGSYDANGAMLDKIAADALGVSVGDSISFTLLGRRFTKKVAAIYLPSNFAIMEEGIVAVSLSGDLAAVNMPAAYGGAFIVANDRDAVATLLAGYVGEGNVALTYEKYVEIYCGNKMPNQTDAEYEAECQAQYATYRKNILSSAQQGGGQVVDKMEAYNLVKEQTLTTEKGTRTLMVLTAIASFAVFTAVCIVFTVTNKEDDTIRRNDGEESKRMTLSYSVTAAITSVAVSAVTALSVYLIAEGTYFRPECGFVIVSTALPVLAGIPVVATVTCLYVKNLYKNFVYVKPEVAPVEDAEAVVNGNVNDAPAYPYESVVAEPTANPNGHARTEQPMNQNGAPKKDKAAFTSYAVPVETKQNTAQNGYARTEQPMNPMTDRHTASNPDVTSGTRMDIDESSAYADDAFAGTEAIDAVANGNVNDAPAYPYESVVAEPTANPNGHARTEQPMNQNGASKKDKAAFTSYAVPVETKQNTAQNRSAEIGNSATPTDKK